MLNKIENISLNSERKETFKLLSGDTSSISLHKKLNPLDSVTFSSALIFLSQLKWKLKSFRHNNSGQIHIEFLIGDFTFKCLLEFPTAYSKQINYTISNQELTDINRLNHTIQIAFDYDQFVNTPMEGSIKLNFILLLFERVLSTEHIVNLHNLDTYYMERLTEDINNGLKEELNQIHKRLISFLEKLTGEEFTQQFDAEEKSEAKNKSIKILSINVQKS